MAPQRRFLMVAHNIFAEMLDRVRRANDDLIAAGVLPAGIDLSRVTVEPPRDPTHGDMATNAAMVLAKDAGKKPRELAEVIAQKLRADDLIGKVEVAGPGFINLTLKPSAWITALRNAVQLGPHYGESDVGRGAAVNVEYVSANPTGPMHIGHCRGAVFGDALANLLAFTGFKVTREYYVNDAGAQVDALARSVYWRYSKLRGNERPIPEGFYPGEYVEEVALKISQLYGDTLIGIPEKDWFPIVRKDAIHAMIYSIQRDLDTLDIRHDVFFNESSLVAGSSDRVGATIRALRQRGYVYEGRLPPPRGAPVEDWEDREQMLFRSTAFGDDIDRPLKKSDGSYTYFAFDIAYHADKIRRGFRALIDVWGADHGGYIKRMKAAVAALSDGTAELDVKLIQLVRLLRAGEPVKMSKRAGEFVTLREVVDEVERDAVRFMMLFRKNDAVLDFDLAKVIEQSRDNPVFYVQYGHARGQSVFRNAREAFSELPADFSDPVVLAEVDLERLSDPTELALMRRIALYPRVVEAASVAHEPHRIAFYLFDLASEFHALWTLGNSSPHLRFIIQNDRQMTVARLVLVQGVVTVLASGLALLGVQAPNEMR
ncbi:MAG: arginine--tRNA ligase [Xanthobacteraceae bacterium]|jgi:arginyl-tRNA synthetase